jgi:FkbM family methyltransferase
VDVGANLGTTTVPALLTFGAARGVAIEPEPFNYRLLRCNLIANDLEERVVTIRAAASDRAGAGFLQLSAWNSGDHRLRPDGVEVAPEAGASDSIAVPLERLDDLLAAHLDDLSEIGVVWIDCQGHEGYVLTGAPKLLASEVPVLCEYWPYGLRRTDNLTVFHELIAANYKWVVNIGDAAGQDPQWLPAAEIATLERSYPEQTFTDLILLKHGGP